MTPTRSSDCVPLNTAHSLIAKGVSFSPAFFFRGALASLLSMLAMICTSAAGCVGLAGESEELLTLA